MQPTTDRHPAYRSVSRTVRLTYEELWAIDTYVRDHNQQGHRWDAEWSRAIHEGILAYQPLTAEKRADYSHPVTAPLEFWWWVEAQVPGALRVGSDLEFGRKLRIKVFTVLHQEEASQEVNDVSNKLLADVSDALARADDAGRDAGD